MSDARAEASDIGGLYAAIIGRSWADPAFKARLLLDPRTVLSEGGILLEGDISIVEESADEHFLVLPPLPPHLHEVNDYQLNEPGTNRPMMTCSSGDCGNCSTQSSRCATQSERCACG